MAIPNIPSLYQKIARGAEGGLEFARIINQLLVIEGKQTDCEVIITDDAAGDFKGVDCIIRKLGSIAYTGFQYKYYPSNLSIQHKRRIEESLINAIDQFPEMEEWILVTPEDFTKYDAKWFESLKKKYAKEPECIEIGGRKYYFKKDKMLTFQHWGHTAITGLMLEYPSIGRYYYREELFAHDENKLVLSKVSVDTENTIWFHSGRFKNRVIQDADNANNKKSSELVFDIQFINNSEHIYHLQYIYVHLDKIWTKLKGFPKDEILRPIGSIEVDIDFKKK
ncbi:MAG: hypothetical protein M0D57_10565 [Sphingobacteriales bacterium JAD_PAG50586_3]|nr:MAG: hypothetical protein M0D57_10565 [Sphingobacteriales bacterium JAD_PAG50586_3]